MSREICEIAVKVGDEIYCDSFTPCVEVKSCPNGYDQDSTEEYFARCVDEESDVSLYGYDGDCV